MTDFKLDAFLPYQLNVLAGRLSRGFAEIYRERFGLTVAEWRVLAHLNDGSGASVREISAAADLEKSRVSRAVSRLEARGLVTRDAGDGDKRLVSLALTPAGVDMVARIVPLARAYEAQVRAALADDARFSAAIADALDTTAQT
ncbi:MAG: MarR family winged helix-turn-helix transcriptional regulator [Pseudomonadota bacterium]